MRVYSLKEQKGSPRYQQALLMNYYFWQRGYEVIDFAREQLTKGEFDYELKNKYDEVMFVASVGVMNEVFERAGKNIKNIDFPEELDELDKDVQEKIKNFSKEVGDLMEQNHLDRALKKILEFFFANLKIINPNTPIPPQKIKGSSNNPFSSLDNSVSS